jgi:hypothetical protein
MSNPLFTFEELEFISDKSFFLRKAAITGKVVGLLNALQPELKNVLLENKSLIPEAALQSTPKISRGENYEGFPWLVLDYPRVFNHNEVFAFRTLFWWGNSFVLAFQLSGVSFQKNCPAIISNLKSFTAEHCRIAIGTDPWIHNPDDPSYCDLDKFFLQVGVNEILINQKFFKIVKKIPFSQSEKLKDEALFFYKQCIALLAA